MPHYAFSQLDTPGGVRVYPVGRKWYQSKCRLYIPIRLRYTLYANLASFSHNTQRRIQQTNRERSDQAAYTCTIASAAFR